jgi:hypothetical protein
MAFVEALFRGQFFQFSNCPAEQAAGKKPAPSFCCQKLVVYAHALKIRRGRSPLWTAVAAATAFRSRHLSIPNHGKNILDNSIDKM